MLETIEGAIKYGQSINWYTQKTETMSITDPKKNLGVKPDAP